MACFDNNKNGLTKQVSTQLWSKLCKAEVFSGILPKQKLDKIKLNNWKTFNGHDNLGLFFQNKYFWHKTKKMNILNEFCIFKLV